MRLFHFSTALLAAVLLPAALSADSRLEYSGVRVSVETNETENVCRFSIVHRGATGTKHFTLQAPNRLVVDLMGVRILRSKEFAVGDSRCIKGIRFGVQPAGSRVVFDLLVGAPSEYQSVVGRAGFEAVLPLSEIALPATPASISNGLETNLESVDSAEEPVVEPASTSRPTPAPVLPLPSATPTIAPTSTATRTPVPEPTVTPVATATATASATATATATPTGTATATQGIELSEESVERKAVEKRSLNGESFGRLSESSTGDEDKRAAASVSEGDIRLVGEPNLKFKVDQVFIELPSGARAVKDLSLTNTSDERLNMAVQVRHLVEAGLPSEKEVETKGILVSPMFFSLEPGAERQVRIISAGESSDREEAFRVRFAPQRGDFEPEATFT
ncbi:MAG: hypothetical protein RL417_1758, partial [Pseudomonadota bacterium]